MHLMGCGCCSLPALLELDLFPGNGELCSNQSVLALTPGYQNLLSQDDVYEASLPGCAPPPTCLPDHMLHTSACTSWQHRAQAC